MAFNSQDLLAALAIQPAWLAQGDPALLAPPATRPCNELYLGIHACAIRGKRRFRGQRSALYASTPAWRAAPLELFRAAVAIHQIIDLWALGSACARQINKTMAQIASVRSVRGTALGALGRRRPVPRARARTSDSWISALCTAIV